MDSNSRSPRVQPLVDNEQFEIESLSVLPDLQPLILLSTEPYHKQSSNDVQLSQVFLIFLRFLGTFIGWEEEDILMSAKKFRGLAQRIASQLFTVMTFGILNAFWNQRKPEENWILDLQAEELGSEMSHFNCVVRDDLQALKSFLHADPELIYKRDACGATVIHVAYLYERYAIGRWLVEHYPKAALLCYSLDENGDHITPIIQTPKRLLSDKISWIVGLLTLPTLIMGAINDFFMGSTEDVIHIRPELMPYTGENILHMTIIRRNMVETRWLLDFFKNHHETVPGGLRKLLSANARGKQFRHDGTLYFGGYPLHFAVCCNDVNIFDLVLSFSSLSKDDVGADNASERSLVRRTSLKLPLAGSAREAFVLSTCDETIFSCDSYGNNALHLCVKYGLKEMYSHITKTAITIIKRELKVAYAAALTKIKHGISLNEFELDSAFKMSPQELTCFPPLQRKVKMPKIDENQSISRESFHIWLETEAKRKLDERMKHVLNQDFHSPLTLAADFTIYEKSTVTDDFEAQKLEILRTLLAEEKEKLRLKWEFGPIKATSIDLAGIDIPYNRKNYKIREIPRRAEMYGVIEWLCRSDSEQGLIIPELKKIIEAKWDTVGAPLFLFQFYRHLIVAISVIIISFDSFDIPAKDPSSANAAIVLAAYVVGCVFIFSSVIADLLKSGFFFIDRKHTSERRGAGTFELYVRYVISASYLVLVVSKFTQAGLKNVTTESMFLIGTGSHKLQKIAVIALASCVTSTAFYFYYFLMGFRKTAPFLLTIQRIASRDMPFFFKFYVVTIIAFGLSIGMITRMESAKLTGISGGVVHSIFVMYNLIDRTLNMGITDVQGSAAFPELEWLFQGLITLFYICVNLLMLNLLIGMISDTYSQLKEAPQGLVLMEQYNILCSMDSPVPEIHTDRLLKYALYKVEDDRYEFEFTIDNTGWTNADSTTKEDSAKKKMIALIIINPQADFHGNGAVAVADADDTSSRIASMLSSHMDSIDDIFVTLQSHHNYHIGHPGFWRDQLGDPPRPGVTISLEDFNAGIWKPINTSPENMRWCTHYLSELALDSKLPLRIWPPHCVVGSRGHCIVPPISSALRDWEGFRGKTVFKVMTAQNQRAQVYSALQAEVEDSNDLSTSLNDTLLNMLKIYDKVLICGHTLSHAVNFTVRDMIKNWSKDTSKLVVLEDGCSNLASFNSLANDFMMYAQDENVEICTIQEAALAFFTKAEGKSRRLLTRAAVDNTGRRPSISIVPLKSPRLRAMSSSKSFKEMTSNSPVPPDEPRRLSNTEARRPSNDVILTMPPKRPFARRKSASTANDTSSRIRAHSDSSNNSGAVVTPAAPLPPVRVIKKIPGAFDTGGNLNRPSSIAPGNDNEIDIGLDDDFE